MKKIKIMLLSLVVLAVVGGALAFKAKDKFSFEYCFTNAVRNAQGVYTCPTPTEKACLLLENVTTTSGTGFTVCTTPFPAVGDCDDVTCPTVTKILNDGA